MAGDKILIIEITFKRS